MIELELRTTQYNPRTRDLRWVRLAALRVDGDEYSVVDPSEMLDLSLRLPSPRYAGPIAFEDDREEWTRALTLVWNAPDLVPVVVRDSNPWPVTEVAETVPMVPDALNREYQPEPASAALAASSFGRRA